MADRCLNFVWCRWPSERPLPRGGSTCVGAGESALDAWGTVDRQVVRGRGRGQNPPGAR